MKKIVNTIKGFTILELIVSLAIFAMMTALVLSKYGNFNQNILLTNLAYDVALTVRNAQSYGLNVKSSTRTANDFSKPYGVYFSKAASPANTTIIFFTDTNSNDVYTAGTDAIIQSTTITRGSIVSAICVYNNGACTDVDNVSVVFRRPDPSAIIKVTSGGISYANLRITLRAIDNTTKVVIVNSTGQVSVEP
jgi:prepilin-type N-terminal cleavage/methylation domain-containing protein